MTQVLFFPANKLDVSVCPIYNDHAAIVSQNTDRLRDGQYELAEINLFRHNIQGTSFLNPTGVRDGENSTYADTLTAVGGTGRISFGLYYRTDRWVNPVTGISQQPIPDYHATAWTAAGAAVFANAVEGEPKQARYPNHGQQMYDISGGQLGYDAVTQQFGASGASETIDHAAEQINYFKAISGVDITACSYANGRPESSLLLPPYLLGGRNSAYSYTGSGNISYEADRAALMSQASTTRAWDAERAGQFPDQSASLLYMQDEIRRAISAGGWFSDFMHWHSLYNSEDTVFFDPFYAAMDEAIGISDVWRAGNNEVLEYLLMRESIDKIGSFIEGDHAYVFVRFNDAFTGTDIDGIPSALPSTSIKTPLSVRVDLSGTPLAGLDIQCPRASMIRNVGTDEWVISFEIGALVYGYSMIEVSAATGPVDYYDPEPPVLSYAGGRIQSDRPCKFVVWEDSGAGWKAVYRSSNLSTQRNLEILPGRSYCVGGITHSRISALIDI